ncbi:G-D-S-L family lipolytic protein [Flavobacterium sp. SUN052]|uniref:G-D-S-L family lipolytic protein n=1 Tax=Flavobacterium sp. SUN052 TaxID=3002441 RepID=UPI00237D8237|nr:G-D-S-L family lipolytic protein [Flavobacterium sp. SUN052]MEC4003321.1 G-D-S-L family lipolytic protein [Flavobacterium sp. SUN052]
MIKNMKWLLLVSLTFVACNESNDDVVVNNSSDGLPLTSGTADFSKYVSLGNSLTAGYSDSALFIEGQKGSYPSILSQQFALVGGGDFKIPFMNDNIGGLLLGGTQVQGPRLYFNGTGPVPVSGTPSTEITTHLTGSFNNMGVPGAKSFHLLAPGYGNAAGVATGQANPYYVRFASSATSKVIDDATAQNPTFFSLWIGNNDVLAYATSGGTGVNQTGNLNPATYGANDITDPTVFASVYNTLVTNLTANGAKGVVANLPYVTSVPFFTTVPTNPIPGLPASSAAQLNQLFGGINAALTGNGLPTRFVTLVADDGNSATVEANPLLIKDESLLNISAQITAALIGAGYPAPTANFLGNLYGQARHASNAAATRDYILLTARTIIGTTQAGVPAPFNTVGVSYPMQDNTTLTATETAEVKVATDSYNATIQSLATSKGLAFVNANTILGQVASSTGFSSYGFTMTSTYVTGNSFSLDGVHPSPRGYALIANKFIEAINTTYGSNLKGVNLGNYRILFPASL